MIIAAPRLFIDGVFISSAAVEFEADRITAVHRQLRPTRDVIQLDHGFLAPGLIDIHNNGAFGIDCATADPSGILHLARMLAAKGVTSFAPTIVTAAIPELHESASRIAAAHPGADAASILGLHLEGPFLSHAYRGAHPAELLVPPSEANLNALLGSQTLRQILRLVTIAPELPGALEAITRLHKCGVLVALGHTGADSATSLRAVAAGASIATHVFNAMAPLHHRTPGLCGIALTDPRVSVCIIADGVHLDPAILRLCYSAAPNRAVAVTDSISLAGLPSGATASFGGATAILRDGAARRADGSLCGAAITLDQGLTRLIDAGIPPEAALHSATAAAARALGMSDRGRITPGARADLVWFDDNFSPLETWIGGRAVHGTIGTQKQIFPLLLPTEIARPELSDLDLQPSEVIVQSLLDQEAATHACLQRVTTQLAQLADIVARTIANAGRVFTLGAGTSGRLAVLDAVECGPTFSLPPGIIVPLLAGGDTALTRAAEGAEDDGAAAIKALDSHGLNTTDLVIGISASGNTEFVRAGLAYAQAIGAITAAIINNKTGTIIGAADHLIVLDTGPEILAGSTRLSAGTAQKIALNILSTTAMIRLGKTLGTYMVELQATNAKLRDRATRIVCAITKCDEERAASTLAQANYAVKTAVIMIGLNVDIDTANRRLAQAGGRLRDALA